eukprot:GHVQ01025079.1.p1 GENE.GHVQ01025079.1~~GHVQ01025079.1.p1  ORF type:complete len:363 (-),score=33.76 GHVQ01025079.1:173-1261(-)
MSSTDSPCTYDNSNTVPGKSSSADNVGAVELPSTGSPWRFPFWQCGCSVFFLVLSGLLNCSCFSAMSIYKLNSVSQLTGCASSLVIGGTVMCLVMSFYFVVMAVAKWNHLDTSGRGGQMEKLDMYQKLQGQASDSKDRREQGVEMTTRYYDIVTDWYENCWGQSFQLGSAQGFPEESFDERCRRHDYWFANRAGIKRGEKWLDVGCGIGGPLRNIVRFTEAQITGVNYNQYQLQRARIHLKAQKMEDYGSFVYCDMTKISDMLEPESLDGIYALESLCHVPDKITCLKGFYKLLKPGGVFATVDWLMTDKFCADNDTHVHCKRSVEILGGIPNLVTAKSLVSTVTEAGFHIIQTEDMSVSMS